MLFLFYVFNFPFSCSSPFMNLKFKYMCLDIRFFCFDPSLIESLVSNVCLLDTKNAFACNYYEIKMMQLLHLCKIKKPV